MSKIEAPLASPLAHRGPVAREASNSFLLLLALTIALALAAAGVLARSLAEPVLMTVLAVLAALGLLAVLATAAGLIRLAGERHDAPLAEALLDLQSEGVQVRRPDGVTIYTNRAFAELSGLGAEDAGFGLEHGFAGLPETSEGLFRLTRAAERGYEWDEVLQLPAHDGATGGAGRLLRASVRPLKSGARPGQGPLVVWRIAAVVGEPVAAAPRQPTPAASSAEALETVPAGLFTVTPDGRVTACNAALGQWTGFDRARLAERKPTALAELLGSAAVAAIDAAASARTAVLDLPELDIRSASGGTMPVRVLFRRAAQGSEGLGLVLPRGASARPQAATDTALMAFADFFHAAPIAIATVDESGRIEHFNQAFDRLFQAQGLTPVTTGASLIERLSVDARAAVRVALQAAAAPGPIPPVSIGFADSSKRSGRLYLSRAGAAPGGRQSIVVHAIDTTQERELEMQFVQSQKMQAVGQFAGGIAHDFNNLLTVIIGFSELLLANHRPTDPAFRDIMEIKQNANRAASLVRQLLAFSRQQTLRPEVLLLTDVISDLSSFLSRSLGERVKLKVHHGRDLWLVKADRTQLEQVIMNLAVNARDAMADGGRLTITTSNMTAEEASRLNDKGLEPADFVVCEVADTGSGMTPDIMEKIFEPFFSTKEVGKGTGLGLSTVYGIVKQTGGYIYVDSTPGKGTAFRIYLPRFREESGQPLARQEKKEKPRDLTGQGTVLLVEDEDAVRRFAVRALQRQGYEVLEAGSGIEALEVMDKSTRAPDLVVSDIVMPEMDGPALLKELRRRNPGIKIIFMSGYAEEALKSLDGGEEFVFLPKPFQLKELLAAVKETMAR